MKITARQAPPHAVRAQALLVAVPSLGAKLTGDLAAADRRLRGALTAATRLGDFKGASGQFVWIPAPRLAAKRVLVVGLGDAAKADAEAVRSAFGLAAGQLRRARVAAVGTVVPQLSRVEARSAVAALVEGLLLGGYTPGAFKTGERAERGGFPDRAVVLAEAAHDLAEVERGIAWGQACAEGALLARELGNQPSNVLTPTQLAAAAQALATRFKGAIRCTVGGPREIEKHKMGGLMGVGRGSSEPSQFVQLDYKPRVINGPLTRIAFVGKGLTFDTGGISIKPAASMDLMKMDMCGAAAVLGAFHILAVLQPQVHALGFIAAAENMPDGKAIKPGDLLTMMNGMTVEVNNTDAEGRLVLADAIHHAKGLDPAFILDVATLTGACQIALGDSASGLMSEDDELVALVQRAAEEVDERVWRLPLDDTHRKRMEGHVADLKNTGAREAGALTAAGFLSYFAKGARWAHLDIAGMAWVEENRPYQPKGATGYGARLLAAVARLVAEGRWKAAKQQSAQRAKTRPRPRRRSKAAVRVGKSARRR
jgi:leucyl aminopeptidase